MTTVQGSPSAQNRGAHIDELVGDVPGAHDSAMPPQYPVVPPEFRILSCASVGGCTWQMAADRCRHSNLQLCPIDKIEEAWPAGRDDTIRAWTADVVNTTDPLGELSRTLTRKNLRLEYGSDVLSGYLVNAGNGADVPSFSLARLSDNEGGVPFDAVCCAVPESRRAFVEFNGYGISGGITFVQHAPEFPTMMLVNLKGLRVTSSAGEEQPIAQSYDIRSYPVPDGSDSDRRRCANRRRRGMSGCLKR